MKKKIISIIFFVLISFPVFSKEKIAYLDVEKIMQESVAGKSIVSQMMKKRNLAISNFKKKKNRLLKKRKNLFLKRIF